MGSISELRRYWKPFGFVTDEIQDSPLYISFVNLKDVNKVRVTLDLEQLQVPNILLNIAPF